MRDSRLIDPSLKTPFAPMDADSRHDADAPMLDESSPAASTAGPLQASGMHRTSVGLQRREVDAGCSA